MVIQLKSLFNLGFFYTRIPSNSCICLKLKRSDYEFLTFNPFDMQMYCKSSKNWGRQVWANSEDPDQTAPFKEQSDQGLHCLPF